MTFDYVVIGAGPAGIATVGRLLDLDQTVLWYDIRFSGGRIEKYLEVPSNTKVKHFIEYFKMFPSLGWSPEMSFLSRMDPETTCSLKIIYDELMRITDNLLESPKVRAIQKYISKKSDIKYPYRHAIFCTGSIPKYTKESLIPLDAALNITTLQQIVLDPTDTPVVVYGSSHSATLVMMNFYNLGYRNITCIYKSKPKYAEYLPDRIRYNNTGLKGKAALWMKKHHDLINWEHYNNYSLHIKTPLVVYAVGFTPGPMPFNIEPRWCFGIAFPERIETPEGPEDNVGMLKFAKHIKSVINIEKVNL